jgi:ribosomal protein S18 acetylase RimI-like enzyme
MTTGMTLRIRKAVIGDENLLATMNSFVQEIHTQNRPDQFKATDAAELGNWYQSLLQKPATRIWIAEHDGQAVGYLLAILHRQPETPFTRQRHWCEIDQVAVDPAWRRKGLAREMIAMAVAEAKAEGFPNVELTSWSFNQGAHEMFRKLGFRPKTVRFELRPTD